MLMAVPWMAEYLLKNKAALYAMLEYSLKGLCFFQQTSSSNHHQVLFIIKVFTQTGNFSPQAEPYCLYFPAEGKREIQANNRA